MGKNKKKKRQEIFFPYYINQSRLLDIYAILNGGYSEYSEITTSVSVQKSKASKADGQASGGFKLVNLGGTISGNSSKTDEQSSENREKKVHTITSILSMVKASPSFATANMKSMPITSRRHSQTRKSMSIRMHTQNWP